MSAPKDTTIVTPSYTFKPPSQMHLRNLLTTFRHGAEIYSDQRHPDFVKYCRKVLPYLENQIALGHFKHLPEFI